MESPAPQIQFCTWSFLVKYAVVSAINLALILTGFGIGLVVSPHLERPVRAQAQIGTPQQTTPTSPPVAATEQQYEDVAPNLTMPSIGVGTILAHRIAADEIMVNG